jgi:hypothetical protein
MKIEGSASGSGSKSGSISKRHGSADPDPHQNVMDPEHWKKVGQLTFPPPLLLLLLDPRWMKIMIRDPGETSRIRNTGSQAFQFFSTDTTVLFCYESLYRGSVGLCATWCMVGPSSNFGSAPHGEFAHWADRCEMGLSECLCMDVWMYLLYQRKIIKCLFFLDDATLIFSLHLQTRLRRPWRRRRWRRLRRRRWLRRWRRWRLWGRQGETSPSWLVYLTRYGYCNQCFGSGLDPDSVRSADPDSDPDPGGLKWPIKIEKS